MDIAGFFVPLKTTVPPSAFIIVSSETGESWPRDFGETRVETVTAEIKGEGLKHLVKVVIDTDGDKGEATAEVTATDGHPFWVPELGQWLTPPTSSPANGSAPAPARSSSSQRSNAGLLRLPQSTT
nr:hypothetical protein [Streptomyces sp. RO-S4]